MKQATRDLLARAQSVAISHTARGSYYNEECAHAALAWVRGEITLGQLSKGAGLRGNQYGTIYHILCEGLKYAIHNGMVK